MFSKKETKQEKKKIPKIGKKKEQNNKQWSQNACFQNKKQKKNPKIMGVIKKKEKKNAAFLDPAYE